jgi:hypothetical protein
VPYLALRGLRTAAPLKRRLVVAAGSQRKPLRGLRTAAPLKRAETQEPVSTPPLSPRSPDRGPVEAWLTSAHLLC